MAEQRLRRRMALARGEIEPIGGLTRVLGDAIAVEIHAREIILSVGVAEIGGGVAEEIESAGRRPA